MKKLVSLFLVALMLVCTTAYAAEAFDFSAMSTDELLALREQLNAEIRARIGDDMNLIGDGVYVAGVDIKPGVYQITCTAISDDREMYVNLFESLDNYKTYDSNRWQNTDARLHQSVLYEGSMCTVNLTEGMTIEIYNGTGRMEAAQPDWAM